MSDIKWIKVTTDMFDDEKIKVIAKMPAGSHILMIWIRLLILAGRCNDGGLIYLSSNIPYTDDMLADVFDIQLATVQLALTTFIHFGMITISTNQFIEIVNWEKHQNVEQMYTIREQTRARVRRHRERIKAISGDCNVTGNDSNAAETRQTKNKTKKENIKPIVEPRPDDPQTDDEIKQENVDRIIKYLNARTKKKFLPTSKETKGLINARLKEGRTLLDFKHVIDVKCEEWLNTEHDLYLRPSTLFIPTNFENYVNQKLKTEIVGNAPPVYKDYTDYGKGDVE